VEWVYYFLKDSFILYKLAWDFSESSGYKSNYSFDFNFDFNILMKFLQLLRLRG